MTGASTTIPGADRLRPILAIAAPVGIVVFPLLSLCTLWFAALIRSAPLLEPEGVINWQGQTELIMAYANFGWIGLTIITYWRGWLTPTALSLGGFVVNYAAWVVMTIQVPI